jgi:hypothetical protein
MYPMKGISMAAAAKELGNQRRGEESKWSVAATITAWKTRMRVSRVTIGVSIVGRAGAGCKEFAFQALQVIGGVR